MVCRCGPTGVAITVFCVGAAMLAIGLSAVPVVEKLMSSIISQEIPVVSDKSMMFDVWQNSTSVPILMTFYLFNLTNPEEVKTGAKPSLKMVGPFVYNEVRIKHHYHWNEDETEVTYRYNRTFTAIDKKCRNGTVYVDSDDCTLDDQMMITTGNIPLAGIGQTIDNLAITQKQKNSIFNILKPIIAGYKESTFMTRPAHDIIFGYKDPLLATLDGVIKTINKDFKQHIPPLPDEVIIQQNNTDMIWKNDSKMYTGKDDFHKAFRITNWAGYNESLGLWTGTTCPPKDPQSADYIRRANMINGTEGTAFQPNLKNNTILYVFSDDLLRSAECVHTENVELKGITLHRYRIVKKLMQNMTLFPENCAFDAAGPSGTLNMTAVVGGPVFASKPHFLDADPSYREPLDGLAPADRDRDDTMIDVEPHTGSSMHVQQRLQINVRYLPIPGFTAFENIRKGGFFLPVLKANEHGMVTDDLAHLWNSQVGIALEAEGVTAKVGVLAGGVLLAVSAIIVVAILARRKFKHDYHILDHHDPAYDQKNPYYGSIDNEDVMPRHSMHSIAGTLHVDETD